MNQQEQKELVLLYSLIELDGGSRRKNVLQHIQENGYWYKNDQNDVSRTTRKEMAWRNDFSYERQHLVEKGYMQHGVQGFWKITQKGKEHVNFLIEKLRNISLEDTACFTVNFYQKLVHERMQPEFTADQILLEQLSQTEDIQEVPLTILSNKPIPKGPVLNRLVGGKLHICVILKWRNVH